MSAGKNRQQDQNSFSSAVITKSAGLSFLEALFIGLTLMALIGGGLVQAVQKTHQTKILIITENGEAIAQWLHSAYLLKQISTPSDDLPCKENSIDTELACFQEMLDGNSIFSTLKNPFFPERDSAPIIALFQGNVPSPITGKSCGKLADRFSILTASGYYLGKPRFWRGTILIYLREYTAREQGLSRYFVVGFCDFKDRYQQLSTNIFLS